MSFVAGLNTWLQMTAWEGFFSEGRDFDENHEPRISP
jgi:hypothetical protein